MTDPMQQTRESSVTLRLRELVQIFSSIVDDASEDQKTRLLSLIQSQRFLNFLLDWGQRDQRKHSRKSYTTAVTYATQDRAFKDFVTNISSAGVFIETGEPFSVGQEITLIFSFPYREEPIRIAGEVVHNVTEGIGVKFPSPDSDLEEMIEAL